jgi:hypothetical protein
MTLLTIASKAGMTVTELKSSIIQKVEILQALGMTRKEAEAEVKNILFKTLKGE